jgi:anti-sigma regulatory factor (Ser/Thr protein kinase)
MTETVALPVEDTSRVGEARRIATALAGRLGLDEATRGRIALVVTEAASNLVRHARGGELLFNNLSSGEARGLEVLALDRGPGIENLARCLSDGYSTGGTAGAGLGAISRMSDQFDIHSAPGTGTALIARVWGASPANTSEFGSLEAGGVCLPKPGEEVGGDTWLARMRPGRGLVAVADGLGHGQTAAEASREAMRIVESFDDRAPKDVVESAHLALRSTRGAAIAVAELLPREKEIRYAGVGNISGSVLTHDRTTHMVSHNGTVGHQVRKVQEFVYAWPEDALIVLHSDGLSSQWRLDRYAGLLTRHPSLIAGVLYRDFKRGRDDVTVVAVRRTPPKPVD